MDTGFVLKVTGLIVMAVGVLMIPIAIIIMKIWKKKILHSIRDEYECV